MTGRTTSETLLTESFLQGFKYLQKPRSNNHFYMNHAELAGVLALLLPVFIPALRILVWIAGICTGIICCLHRLFTTGEEN